MAAVKGGSNDPAFGNADLTNCDREPIHIPGSIQPHGAMLIYDPGSQNITHASANAPAMLGIDPARLIGYGLHDVIGADAAHAVRNTVAKSVAPAAPGLLFGQKIAGSDKRFDVAAHTYLGRTFLEFQESGEDADAYGPLVDPRGRVVGTVFAATTGGPRGGFAIPAEQVRQALGRTVESVDTGPCTA